MSENDKELFTDLKEPEDIEVIVAESQSSPVIIFKHSATCPISAEAHDEVTTFAEEYEGIIFRVIVQEARELCKIISEEFDVPHQTPQILIVHKGECLYEISHEDVTFDEITDYISRVS